MERERVAPVLWTLVGAGLTAVVALLWRCSCEAEKAPPVSPEVRTSASTEPTRSSPRGARPRYADGGEIPDDELMHALESNQFGFLAYEEVRMLDRNGVEVAVVGKNVSAMIDEGYGLLVGGRLCQRRGPSATALIFDAGRRTSVWTCTPR